MSNPILGQGSPHSFKIKPPPQVFIPLLGELGASIASYPQAIILHSPPPHCHDSSQAWIKRGQDAPHIKRGQDAPHITSNIVTLQHMEDSLRWTIKDNMENVAL